MVAQVESSAPSEDAIAFANCAACPLRGSVKRPVFGRGNPDATLVVIGEAPGAQERLAGRPFVGPSGRLLDATLARCGLPRSEVYVTNAVLCASVDKHGDDASPPKEAVLCCRPRLVRELRAVGPTVVLAVGGSAAKALMQTDKGITEIQGVVEHVDGLPAPVLPTFHPAAVLRGDHDKFDDILAAIGRAVKIARGELAVPPRDEHIPWKHVTTPRDAYRMLLSLALGDAGYTLSIDVETGGLDVVSDPLLQVVIGNTEKAVVFEADALIHPNGLVYEAFCNLLRSPKFTWLIHNSSFDLQRFARWFGVGEDEIPNVVDTLCLAMGLTERGSMVGLKRLSREWLNAAYYEKEVHQYLNADGSGWENVPRDVLAKYAALDGVYTARVYPILDRLCAEEGTRDLAYGLLMPAQRAFAGMERHGVLVDRVYLAGLEAEWQPKIDAAERAVQEYVSTQGFKVYEDRKRRVKRVVAKDEPRWRYLTAKGEVKVAKTKPKKYPDAELFYETVAHEHSEWETYRDAVPVNIGSDQQMQRFVFDHLRLTLPEGKRTIDKSFKALHAAHPFVRLHEEWRLANRMMTTYVRGIGKVVRADGRVHPSFKLFGAVTGRLSMTDPPLQTIPREGTVGKGGFASIKRIFVPSPGHVWLSADYAQLEARVAWGLSGDEALGAAIMSGDFHKAMAAKIFKVPVEAVTDEQRQRAKTVNFGIFFGITAAGLSRQLNVSEEEGQMLIDGFFEAAPKYREWNFSMRRKALEEGRIVTPFGRVRRWNLITHDTKQSILNQAVNFPIQSTASDIALTALIKLDREVRNRGLGHALLSVHDSIELEIKENRIPEAVALVRETMTTWPLPHVPFPASLEVEVKVGNTWGTTKVWEEPA